MTTALLVLLGVVVYGAGFGVVFFVLDDLHQRPDQGVIFGALMWPIVITPLFIILTLTKQKLRKEAAEKLKKEGLR